jgi:hypothetical protein
VTDDQPRTALTRKPKRTPWPPADMPDGHAPVYLQWDDETDQCVMRNGGASDDPSLVYYVPERTRDLWFGTAIAWDAAKSQAFWDYISPRLDLPDAAPAETTPEPAEPVHDELWRHLDWSFWGTGMADTFREPLADTMVAAITAEQRQQANDLIDRWREHREFVGRNLYEAQKAEIERLRALLTEAGINPDEEQK